ncbi:hypothetical protein EYF80_030079 [Liparis tanakae]|uniref:Uncharacterized protein n=1 Tax=Liparis tanakae TaxID=230148 RepID=A0A4Z2H1H7_9TELE|nr:hypothetical protein EYF80_030079 [Liparis tanakae]
MTLTISEGSEPPGSGPVVRALDLWSGFWTSGSGSGPVVRALDQWSGFWTSGPGSGPVVRALDLWSGLRPRADASPSAHLVILSLSSAVVGLMEAGG